MIPQKKGIPQERFSLTADVQGGFYALGKNPSFMKRYFFACLQAGYNLSRQLERANAFIINPQFTATRLRSIALLFGGAL